MAKAAQSADLKAAFEKHRGETQEHVARLEEVFEVIGKKPAAKICAAIMGITEEGAEIMEEYPGSAPSTPACSQRRRRSSTTRFRATERCGPGQRSLA